MILKNKTLKPNQFALADQIKPIIVRHSFYVIFIFLSPCLAGIKEFIRILNCIPSCLRYVMPEYTKRKLTLYRETFVLIDIKLCKLRFSYSLKLSRSVQQQFEIASYSNATSR